MNGFGMIKVSDYRLLGEWVDRWARDSASLPATVAEFKHQTMGTVFLPEHVTKIKFVQSTNDTVVIRLPGREALYKAKDYISQLGWSSNYPLPPFYLDIVEGKLPAPQALPYRVADCAISEFD